MHWLQVVITATREHAEPIEAMLEEAGALSVAFTDAGDDPQLEPFPGTAPLWSRVCVTGLFSGGRDTRGHLERLLAPLTGHAGAVRFETLEDRPWERAWLEDFVPTSFGRRLWVCPRGQRAEAEDAVVVELDPGLAFGTGHHATTALCLRWLDGATLAGAQVLDYGCGSGILAIAALRLGAASAIAVDHDPQALEATRANALDNGVNDKLMVCTPEDLPETQADVVLANILAGPLVELAPLLCRRVGVGGRLVLSGLLIGQQREITAAYGHRFDFDPPRVKEDWVLLSARRKS
jgi:ribosomal protein L11 methyltransferase